MAAFFDTEENDYCATYDSDTHRTLYWFKILVGSRTRNGWLTCRMVRITRYNLPAYSIASDEYYDPGVHNLYNSHYMSIPYTARPHKSGALKINKCGTTEQFIALPQGAPLV